MEKLDRLLLSDFLLSIEEDLLDEELVNFVLFDNKLERELDEFRFFIDYLLLWFCYEFVFIMFGFFIVEFIKCDLFIIFFLVLKGLEVYGFIDWLLYGLKFFVRELLFKLCKVWDFELILLLNVLDIED